MTKPKLALRRGELKGQRQHESGSTFRTSRLLSSSAMNLMYVVQLRERESLEVAAARTPHSDSGLPVPLSW